MPENIKQGARFWGEEYSVERAHSGSQDTAIGGNVNNHTYDEGHWATRLKNQAFPTDTLAYFRAVTGIGGSTGEIAVESAFFGGDYMRISNIGPGEVFTTPFEGIGSIICEATPGSTWEWSIEIGNMFSSNNVTVDMHIFGLDAQGNRLLEGTNVASGSEQTSGIPLPPTEIPSDRTEYVCRRVVPPYTGTLTKLHGFATLADLGTAYNPIRYLSMRIDVNDEVTGLEFTNFYLNPLNQRRGDRPLIWNSPRLFKPRENFTWLESSENESETGANGEIHEYLRLTLDYPATQLPQVLDDANVAGYRYGPLHGSSNNLTNSDSAGGTQNAPFPSSWTHYGDFDPAVGIAPGYRHWLLHFGSTQSTNVGPYGGIPPLPRNPDDPGRRHYGWKRSSEPIGIDTGELFSYFYTEGSSNAYQNRHALRMPKINFNQTNHSETLSFYFHASSYQHGTLKIYHQERNQTLFIPGDFNMPSYVSDYPGDGQALPLENIKIFNDAGSYENDYIEVTEIDGNAHFPSAVDTPWYRAEVDLSEIRGLNTHIIFLYSGASGYRSDFAIANILITGMSNDTQGAALIYGCGNPYATNYDPAVTYNINSFCVFSQE